MLVDLTEYPSTPWEGVFLALISKLSTVCICRHYLVSFEYILSFKWAFGRQLSIASQPKKTTLNFFEREELKFSEFPIKYNKSIIPKSEVQF